jgi:hypothetical protein
MPVSDPGHISPVITEALRLRPNSVLDLGVGVGIYGALLRQYLDLNAGRLERPTWESVIVGVEGFKHYQNLLWDMYSFIENDNFSDPEQVIRYKGFDLVLMIDSLEHLDGRTGAWLLDTLVEMNKHVIVSVPIAPAYLEQGAVHGNDLEIHRHNWTKADFEVRGAKILHEGLCLVASLEGRG